MTRRAARRGHTAVGPDAPPPGRGPTARVEVRLSRPRPGFLHPAGVDDIRRLLVAAGPSASYGLRRVELRHRPDRESRLCVAALPESGVVVLYEQPCPPWFLTGRLAAASLHRLHRAGARVTVAGTLTRVDWSAPALRDFLLFDGLMHEVGHHRVQQAAGGGPARAMRTADHERRADAYAAACRRAWPGDR